jgi:hypothetical protein
MPNPITSKTPNNQIVKDRYLEFSKRSPINTMTIHFLKQQLFTNQSLLRGLSGQIWKKSRAVLILLNISGKSHIKIATLGAMLITMVMCVLVRARY